MATVPITLGRLLDEYDGRIEPAPVSVPVTFGRSLDEHDGRVIFAAFSVPVTLGRLLDELDGVALEGPYIRGTYPLKPVCVQADTAIMTFEAVTLLPDAIDLTTIVVTVTFDGVTTETVYTGGAFQAPYVTASAVVHSVTGLEDIQAFSVERDGGWPANTTITVLVTGQNTHVPPQSITGGTWTWCTLPAVVPPPPTPTFVCYTGPEFDTATGGIDTIRGGAEVVFAEIPAAGGRVWDLSRDTSFRALALPASWSTAGTGSATPTLQGLELATLPSAGSDVTLTNTAVFTHFDAAVGVRVLGPGAVRRGSLELFRFRHTAGSDSMQIALVLDGSRLLAIATAVAGGQTLAGHVLELETPVVTLRIVRNGARAWAFLGQRTGRTWTALSLLRGVNTFTASDGALSITARNGVAPVRARVRLTDFTVESHAQIAGRLVDEPKLVASRRVTGIVPAANLDEVGDADFTVFGIFGEAITPNGFEYILPPARTVGRDRTRLLDLTEDAQIKNGD